MTDSFQAHKDVIQFLSQARAMRSALVNSLYCTDVCCEWVSCPHLPSIFWNSFQETEITTISKMMEAAMSSNSFAIVKLATAMLKMKMLWLSVIPPSSCNRSFLLLRIADFVVDAVDVVDVSVSEIVAFPPSEYLALSGITKYSRYNPSSLLFLVRKVFQSFVDLRRNLELNLRMIFCLSFCTNLPKLRRCWADLQKSPCGEASWCFLHYRRIG